MSKKIKALSNLILEMHSLNFLNNNPGAVKHGNFINYYSFHPTEERTKLIPVDLFHENIERMQPFAALDIGCNVGDLTVALYNLLEKNGLEQIFFLGVDIDPVLITRAKEKCKISNVTFECLDFMDNKKRSEVIDNYLNCTNVKLFNVVFCFSTTMWIHLNNGDEGLKNFLRNICKLTNLIVIEPQPWKCYKSAVKRLKLCNSEFPYFRELKIRNNVEHEVEGIIIKCGFSKIFESERTNWKRKLLIFKNYT